MLYGKKMILIYEILIILKIKNNISKLKTIQNIFRKKRKRQEARFSPP